MRRVCAAVDLSRAFSYLVGGSLIFMHYVKATSLSPGSGGWLLASEP